MSVLHFRTFTVNEHSKGLQELEKYLKWSAFLQSYVDTLLEFKKKLASVADNNSL